MKNAIESQIHEIPLFSEFTQPEIAAFLELAEPISAGKETRIVTQDTPGDAMFIIIQGTVKVIHRVGSKSFELATLSRGDFFGELSLVDNVPRSADVVAIEDCGLLKISQGTIRAIAGVYPSAAFKFLIAVGGVLVKRLRQGNKKYIDSLLIGASLEPAINPIGPESNVPAY